MSRSCGDSTSPRHRESVVTSLLLSCSWQVVLSQWGEVRLHYHIFYYNQSASRCCNYFQYYPIFIWCYIPWTAPEQRRILWLLYFAGGLSSLLYLHISLVYRRLQVAVLWHSFPCKTHFFYLSFCLLLCASSLSLHLISIEKYK